MKQYLKGLKTILEDGYFTGDRTGVGTQALPGYAYKMKLEMEETPEGGYLIKNFPLLTTKKVFMRGTFEELMWKLRGETNIKSLVEKGVHIWTEWPFKKWLESTGEINKFTWYIDDEKSDYTDEWKRRIKEFEQKILDDPEFAAEWGELGPTYGHHMRNFGEVKVEDLDESIQDIILTNSSLTEKDVVKKGEDQLKNVFNTIMNKPTDRRVIISLWNPHDNKKTLLPPCPCFYQFFPNQQGVLHLNVYQRSCDTFLGVPFNDSQDSLFLILMAITTGRFPDSFNHFFGDFHIYNNHRKQVELQLSRMPKGLPTLHVKCKKEFITDYTWDDIEVLDYDPEPAIKAPVAV